MTGLQFRARRTIRLIPTPVFVVVVVVVVLLEEVTPLPSALPSSSSARTGCMGTSLKSEPRSSNRAFSCYVIAAMLEGKNNTFSLLWEIRSIFMQNCFIVSVLQHGCRENPPLFTIKIFFHFILSYSLFDKEGLVEK